MSARRSPGSRAKRQEQLLCVGYACGARITLVSSERELAQRRRGRTSRAAFLPPGGAAKREARWRRTAWHFDLPRTVQGTDAFLLRGSDCWGVPFACMAPRITKKLGLREKKEAPTHGFAPKPSTYGFVCRRNHWRRPSTLSCPSPMIVASSTEEGVTNMETRPASSCGWLIPWLRQTWWGRDFASIPALVEIIVHVVTNLADEKEVHDFNNSLRFILCGRPLYAQPNVLPCSQSEGL